MRHPLLIAALAALSLQMACSSCGDEPTPQDTEQPDPNATPTETPTVIQGGGEVTPTVTPPQPTTPEETNTVAGPTPTEPDIPPTPTVEPTPTVPPTPTPTQLPDDPLTGLELYPKAASLEEGATLQFRFHARTESGATTDITIDEWNSSNEAVATVDADGLLTALSAGSTTVTATGRGFASNSAAITVVAPGLMRVRVTDAFTGAGVVGAQVFHFDTFVDNTDATGWVDVPLGDSGLQTVTAKADGYYYASILGTHSREIELPIRPEKNPTSFTGLANFDDMDRLRTSELRIGLITRSVLENPLALDFNTLIGPLRRVDLCGVTTNLPANFVGEAVACGIELYDYTVPGEPGDYSAFALAGDLDLQDMQALLNNPDFYTNLGAFFADLGPALQDFAYDVVGAVELEAGAATENIAIDFGGRIDQSVLLQVPTVPDGVSAEFDPMQFIATDMGDRGFLPIGLAGGTDLVQVFHPPLNGPLAGKQIYGMAMAAQNGVGDEGPYSMTMASKKTDDPLEVLELPPFMPLLFTRQVDTANRTLEFLPISGTIMYRSILTFTKESPRVEWDLYQLASAPVAPPVVDEPTPTQTPEDGTPAGTPGEGTPFAATETPTTVPTPTATASATPTAVPEPEFPLIRIPNIDGAPQIRDFNWDFSAYDTDRGTYDDFVTGQGDANLHEASEYLIRLSRNIQYHVAK